MKDTTYSYSLNEAYSDLDAMWDEEINDAITEDSNKNKREYDQDRYLQKKAGTWDSRVRSHTIGSGSGKLRIGAKYEVKQPLYYCKPEDFDTALYGTGVTQEEAFKDGFVLDSNRNEIVLPAGTVIRISSATNGGVFAARIYVNGKPSKHTYGFDDLEVGPGKLEEINDAITESKKEGAEEEDTKKDSEKDEKKDDKKDTKDEEENSESEVLTVSDLIKELKEYDGKLSLEFDPIDIDGQAIEIDSMELDDSEDGKIKVKLNILADDLGEEEVDAEVDMSEFEDIGADESEVSLEGEEELTENAANKEILKRDAIQKWYDSGEGQKDELKRKLEGNDSDVTWVVNGCNGWFSSKENAQNWVKRNINVLQKMFKDSAHYIPRRVVKLAIKDGTVQYDAKAKSWKVMNKQKNNLWNDAWSDKVNGIETDYDLSKYSSYPNINII